MPRIEFRGTADISADDAKVKTSRLLQRDNEELMIAIDTRKIVEG